MNMNVNLPSKSTSFHRRNKSMSQRQGFIRQQKSLSINNRRSLHKMIASPGKPQFTENDKQKLLNKAKFMYYHQQNMEKAIKFFEEYLKIDERNQNVLYLCAIAHLHLQNPQKAIDKLLRIKRLYLVDPAVTNKNTFGQVNSSLSFSTGYSFSNFKYGKNRKLKHTQRKQCMQPNSMLLLALAYSKVEKIDRCFQTINECIRMNPDFQEGYCFRGKLFIKTGDLASAQNDFKKLIQLNKQTKNNIAGVVGLADCLRLSDKPKQAIKMYEKSLKAYSTEQYEQQKETLYEIILKHSICLYQLQRYDEAVIQLNKIIKFSQIPSSQAYYFLGQCQMKQKIFDKALLSLQSAVRAQTNPGIMKRAIKSLLRYYIANNQFYQAVNIVSMAQLYKIDGGNLDKLVDGCIQIIKKKYSSGLVTLLQLKEQVKDQNALAKKDKMARNKKKKISQLFSPTAQKSAKCSEMPKIEVMEQQKQEQNQFITPYLLQFSAYAFFMKEDFTTCLQTYQEYDNYCKNVLGIESQPIQYNKSLCQGILMLESEMYEEALEKFSQAQQKYLQTHRKFTVIPLLYRVIALCQLAYSDCPVYGQLVSKNQILVYTVNTINLAIDHLSNNKEENYLLYYFKGLIEAGLDCYPEAKESIHKSLQICEDCTWRILYAKGVTQLQVEDFESAIRQFTAGLVLLQSSDLYLGRCIGYLMAFNQNNKNDYMQRSFEDLQKYIEIQNSQQCISTWVCKVLFYNKAYQQAKKSLQKVESTDNDIIQMEECLHIFQGDFSQGGKQGQTIIEAFLGTLDDSFYNQNQMKQNQNTKKLGYLFPKYQRWLKILNLYSKQAYPQLLKFMQKAMFDVVDTNEQLQIRYNIAIVYLLTEQYTKAQKVLSSLTGFSEEIGPRVKKMISYQYENDECVQDLSAQFNCRRLSNFLPYRQTNINTEKKSTRVFLKISVPFPEFPKPEIILRIPQNFIINEAKQNIIEKKIQAPWIKHTQNGPQFTNMLDQNDIDIFDDDTKELKSIHKKSSFIFSDSEPTNGRKQQF